MHPAARVSQRQAGEEGVHIDDGWFILSANVPRQVSLAGGAGGSNASGVKALGLLFCQQALCLSGGMSKRCSEVAPIFRPIEAQNKLWSEAFFGV